MFLTGNMAGKISKENEVLYEGEIEMIDAAQGIITCIPACYVYETQFRLERTPDFLKVGMDFIVEISCICCNNEGEEKNIPRKFPSHHEIVIARKELTLSDKDGDPFVVPELKSISYDFKIAGSKREGWFLLRADIEIYLTRIYYDKIHGCARIPARENIEPVNWMDVLQNIDYEDVLTLLESFVKLLRMKEIFLKTENTELETYSKIQVEDKTTYEELTRLNTKLSIEVREATDKLCVLRHGINERDEIINRLLTLLDRGDSVHGPEIPRTTIS